MSKISSERGAAGVRALHFARTVGASDEETVNLVVGAADEVAHLRVLDAIKAEGDVPKTLDVPVVDLKALISVALGEQPYTDDSMPDFGAAIIDAWEDAAATVAEGLRARLDMVAPDEKSEGTTA